MFLEDRHKNYINIIVKNVYSSLNNIDLKFLQEKTHNLIDHIHTKFLIKVSNNEKFFEQLQRNNNREIIAITNLLLPFIDDKNNYENNKKIKNFEDISKLESKDENNISNYQYSRGYYDNESDQYIKHDYSKLDLQINYDLLLETINRISSRMYVNWTNIVPIKFSNLASSSIWLSSYEYYFENNKEKKDEALGNDEIYNTLVNDLYISIIDFKWLLFEKIENIDGTEKYIMFLDILDSIYPVYNFIENDKNNKWLLLQESEKNIFSNNFDIFFNKIQKNESFEGKLQGEKYIYKNELIQEFMYYLLVFFDKKYKFKEDLEKNGYKQIFKSEDTDIEINHDYTLDNFKQQKDIAFKNYQIMDKFFIYDFLRTYIIKLSKTWYGYKIFNGYITKKSNKLLKLHDYIRNNNPSVGIKYNEHIYYTSNIYLENINMILNISYKNIYNYSKSLYYFKNNLYKKPFSNYDSNSLYYNDKSKELRENIDKYIDPSVNVNNLSYEDKDNIGLLFNIGANILLKYPSASKANIKNYILTLYFQINKIKIPIVFECLIKRGLLTEYIIRSENFEKKELKENKNSQEKFHNHLKKYEDAYYYLTDKKYKDLQIFINPKTKKEETYFERLKNMDLDWHTYYALDWVSQINFYHHFLNNRVNFLTGGTGVGKSTQVPKLLLYGLKAYDKIFNAKIICTQPRIAPTVDNARRIAAELGVDLEEYNLEYKSMVKTTNGIIQYKYEKDSHIDEDQDFFLRIVTDGSLLSELKDSPLLKQQINLSRSNSAIISDKFYSLKNMYDIVIVDESHEHNPNMDIILTLVRGSIFMNNKLRLIIVSATMDNDDPIYRKYYRFINDNLKYPIRDNWNEQEQKFDILLDRIVIDRRMHISPPGETTQYIIKEIYTPENLNEENAYKKAIEYAKEICNTSSSINSEILLFCTTEKKIIKLVDELNNVLPSNTIAIPFYTTLPEDSKKMITSNLNEIKQTWKFPRKYVHDVLNQKIKPSAINTTNKYERRLIVSTNIAEASITIDTLKFVIETGFNNDVSYNYESGTTNVNIVPITEPSRLQRKGRIGRRGNGTIYYTYPKDARKDIKPLYPICKANFTDSFLSFMEEEYNKDNIYDINFYPYNKEKLKQYNNDDTSIIINTLVGTLIELDINDESDIKQKKLNNTIRDLYLKLIVSQFLTVEKISDELLFTNKLNNINLIDVDIYSSIVPFAKTGISTNILTDTNLAFYLIHPFENKIKDYRQKETRIAIHKDKEIINEKIIDIVETNIIKNLLRNLYVYEEQIYLKIELKHINVYYKSKMVEYLIKLKQNTDKFIEFNLLYPIVVSSKLNILDNVIFIVYFLKEISNDIFGIIDDKEKFNKVFSSKESDLLVINKIYDLFKTTFSYLILEESIDIKKIKLINQFKNLFTDFRENKKIELDYYNLIIKNILKNDDYETFEENITNNMNEVNIALEKKNNSNNQMNEKEIKNWCALYGIKFDIFIKILNTFKYRYFQYKLKFENNQKKKDDFLINSTFENQLTIERNIIKSFMYGNLTNIFYIDNGIYKKSDNIENQFIYKRNTFNKKWISKVINNKFLLVLNLDNEIVFDKSNDKLPDINDNFNVDEEETNNQIVVLTNITAIDNKMYSNMIYINDNPTLKNYSQVNDIVFNYVCNNSINLNHYKNSLDPKFNEYINRLQSSIADYINDKC
jgi:hypothetical protein